MDRNLLSLGPIEIKWYSFFIFLAMLTATYVIFKEARKKNIDEEYLENLIFYGIIFGILGARCYYVIFNLDYYLHKPLEILMIWRGGLAIHGGIIGGLTFLLLYTRKKKENLLLTIDIIVVGLIIGQAIGRWGNFFNSEAYGRITSLKALTAMHIPKFIIQGMYINGYYREPTFLYESALSCICFIVMIILRKANKLKVTQLTSIYLIWYGLERIIIEGLRTDSLMLGPIRVAQLISLISIIIGICILIKSKEKEDYKSAKFH